MSKKSVETKIRTEMVKASMLMGNLMEHYTDENPAEVPGEDKDHFSMFGYVEDTFNKIRRWLDRPNIDGDVWHLLNYCIELQTYFRILKHQAGSGYFDRPAAIGLAQYLVRDFIETVDVTFPGSSGGAS